MSTNNKTVNEDTLEQLGGTDQIEQRAADLAKEEDRTRVTDKDREKALQQMHETSPPEQASKTEE